MAYSQEDVITVWYRLANPKKQRASYLHLPIRDKTKFAQVRFSNTLAAADANRPCTNCRCCPQQTAETIQHLLCECQLFAQLRSQLWLPDAPPTDIFDQWAAFFLLPIPNCLTFFNSIASLFYITTNSKLFSDPTPDEPESPSTQADLLERHYATAAISL